MNSFPPLIPVPVDSKVQGSEEELDAKFATLFSPPTPRASPDLPSGLIFKSQTRPIEQHEAPNSPDSEFGSFVSVPPSEDPLAAPPSFGSPILPSNVPSSSSRPRHVKNPSLSFFDSFAQEAKAAHERNKRDVMDELLHEDGQLIHPTKRNDHKSDAISDSLLDLDLDFFTPKQESSGADGDYISHPHTTRHVKTSSSPHLTRKSTLSQPHGPAPPIASTSSVSSSPPNDHSDTESVTSRSPSYQTLSNISSKWMTSILNKSSSESPPEFEHLSRSSTASSLSAHARSSSDSRNPRHTQTFPSPAISTFNTLRRVPSSSTHPASPFAPHVFVPPSGAPGFKPDGYDWDKGFSGELDKELIESELLDTGNPSLAHIHRHLNFRWVSELKGRREATLGVLDVELAEMIRAQLPALARLPRAWKLLYSLDQHGISLHTLYDKCENQPNLRTGSSGFSTKVGALVVMKDSGDAVFGAYMGDGIKQSKGKGYYGSGESFLWRYVNGTFQVFKWTGKNDYVALCEPEYLSFGGGDGAYGLYLDDSLFDGSSACCPTFNNEPLCSPGVKKGRAVTFECVGLEVWGVGP
ncbi:TLD-domain-containing protein [Gymnopus androsaceus JB14]|uniref:Oxidation resistance protein 1 n=1 Tax=Gymnopus androsaceus JB14 TaxID=1447944 RepID=A0A6A4H7I4_9AGAR|nr:TLD-domain-containing protein [Gymnopus androsaceus JB14]